MENDDMDIERRLCRICGEFMPLEDFHISDEVCGWCDVVIRGTK